MAPVPATNSSASMPNSVAHTAVVTVLMVLILIALICLATYVHSRQEVADKWLETQVLEYIRPSVVLPSRPQPTYWPYTTRLGAPSPVSPSLPEPKVSSPVSLCDEKEVVVVVDSSDASPSEAELDESSFVSIDLDDDDDDEGYTVSQKTLVTDQSPQAIQVSSQDQLVFNNLSSVEPLICPVRHPPSSRPSSVAEDKDLTDQDDDDGLAGLAVLFDSLKVDGVKFKSPLFASSGSSGSVEVVKDSTIITPDKDPTASLTTTSSFSLLPVAQNPDTFSSRSASVDEDLSLDDTSALDRVQLFDTCMVVDLCAFDPHKVQPSASTASSSTASFKDDPAASETPASASARLGTYRQLTKSSSFKTVTNLTRKLSAANLTGRMVKSKSVGVLAVPSAFSSSLRKSKSVKENLQHFRDAARAQKPRWV